MAIYSTSEFRGGMKIMLDGEPFTILENEFVKPGKGQAFNRVRIRNLKTGAVLTVATHRRLNKIDYGVIKAGSDYMVTAFEEKPVYDFTVSMGVYVFSREVLKFVPDGQPFGFDHLMLKLLDQKQRIATYPFDGYWMDIGRPDDYDQAKLDIQSNPGLSE